MSHPTRRTLLTGISMTPLAMPALVRAQSTSKPIRMGLLSDMSGPYRDVGGPGNRLSVELAIQDFGGSVLGRPIETLQADDQNKPDIAAGIAREWIDSQGLDVMMNGMVPGLLHAGNYAAATHWLKAVKAAGTTDADAVVTQMKATSVNDMFNKDVKIREDGRVMHEMHLWQVKDVAESKHPYDYCKQLAIIPPSEAWRPLAAGGCPLIKA